MAPFASKISLQKALLRSALLHVSANVAYAYALVKAMLLEEYIKDEDEPMSQNSLNQFVTPEIQIYELNWFCD